MSNDLIRLAAERAAKAFGGGDGTFNGAGFSNEFAAIAGIRGAIDGHAVRAMLTGRADVRILKDGAHYRLRGHS